MKNPIAWWVFSAIRAYWIVGTDWAADTIPCRKSSFKVLRSSFNDVKSPPLTTLCPCTQSVVRWLIISKYLLGFCPVFLLISSVIQFPEFFFFFALLLSTKTGFFRGRFRSDSGRRMVSSASMLPLTNCLVRFCVMSRIRTHSFQSPASPFI